MLENKKTINKKLIIFVPIVLMLAIIVFLIFSYFEKKDEVWEFKDFTFVVPNDVKFSEINKENFKVDAKNYDASVQIIYDEQANLDMYMGTYYANLLYDDVSVDESENLSINSKTVTIMKKHDDKNSLLIFYNFMDNFVYCIELYNDDNSFDTKNIESIMNVLSHYTYSDEPVNSYYTAAEKFVAYELTKEYLSTNNN